jgi:hypothetical protein
MSDGFPNKPKILRGAFVEYGLSIPPLFVVFQFNPLQLTRNRSLSYSVPGETATTPRSQTLHQKESDLLKIQEGQQVGVKEESITFDIRLDATDDLNDGDIIVGEFGILPRLATLELMVYPKSDSLLGQALGALLGSEGGFSFTKGENPPMILFIWGYTRVLPVNINSINITETEFNTILSPTRATVAVNLTVIEGTSIPYMYSKLAKEAMSVLNLANIAEIADVVIPG